MDKALKITILLGVLAALYFGVKSAYHSGYVYGRYDYQMKCCMQDYHKSVCERIIEKPINFYGKR